MADESELSAAVPTMIANRFYAVVTDAYTRIAFGEMIQGGDPHYHFAVALADADVPALIDLLEQLRAQHQAKSKTAARA